MTSGAPNLVRVLISDSSTLFVLGQTDSELEMMGPDISFGGFPDTDIGIDV